MSLNIGVAYATVWKPEAHEKFVSSNLTTGRKSGKKTDDGKDIYVNSSWNAKFVGKCLAQAKELSEKDRIKITSSMITHEKSEKIGEDGKNVYFYNVTVFEFEKLGTPQYGQSNQNNSSNEPMEENLPF